MIRWALRLGLRKGVIGGSRPWLVLFTAALGIRTVKRLVRDEPEVVLCEELGPGQAIVITHEKVTIAEDRKSGREAGSRTNRADRAAKGRGAGEAKRGGRDRRRT